MNTQNKMDTTDYELLRTRMREKLATKDDDARIPVEYFRQLLPPAVFDEFLYSDEPQTVGKLKELLGKK